MRVLLFSDIHANLEAMEACLAAAPSCDQVVNLGDIVGYGASPNEVCDRSRQLGGLVVRGNHDKACSGVTSYEGFNPVAGLAVLWTRTLLRPELTAWLHALPPGPMTLGGLPEVQFVHGSPLDEDEYLVAMDDAANALLQAYAPIIFFGHTHVQGGFLLGNGDAAVLRPAYRTKDQREEFTYNLVPGRRYLINPGSIGQPRDGDWRAAFAVYDSSARQVTYMRVPYNIAGAQKRIRDAQLPERLAARLTIGR